MIAIAASASEAQLRVKARRAQAKSLMVHLPCLDSWRPIDTFNKMHEFQVH